MESRVYCLVYSVECIVFSVQGLFGVFTMQDVGVRMQGSGLHARHVNLFEKGSGGRVEGLRVEGWRVQGLGVGIRVEVLGFGVRGLRIRDQGLEIRIGGLGTRVQGEVTRVQETWFRDWCTVLSVEC